jgi:hypothetical protein
MSLRKGHDVITVLCSMELHEHHDAMQSKDVHSRITRVPGGWIYYQNDATSGYSHRTKGGVFVPELKNG